MATDAAVSGLLGGDAVVSVNLYIDNTTLTRRGDFQRMSIAPPPHVTHVTHGRPRRVPTHYLSPRPGLPCHAMAAVLRQEGADNKRADLFSCMLIGCRDNLKDNPRMDASVAAAWRAPVGSWGLPGPQRLVRRGLRGHATTWCARQTAAYPRTTTARSVWIVGCGWASGGWRSQVLTCHPPTHPYPCAVLDTIIKQVRGNVDATCDPRTGICVISRMARARRANIR
jgi:hypothetical protein